MNKTLLIAAAVIALALSPSIKECLDAHQSDSSHKWVLWGWAGLVVILAFTAGESLIGAS